MTKQRNLAFIALAALVAGSACSSTEQNDAGVPADASRPDAANPDAAPPDGGHTPDSGETPDAGAATIELVAGSIGGPGNLDGPRLSARFLGAAGVARASDGTIYVADTTNYTIRRIAPDGEVTTLAGSPGEDGHVDGTGAEARFELPVAIAIGPGGDLFVSESYGSTIRRVTPDGVVTTYAGSAGQPGGEDGPRTSARFRAPEALAFDADGNLYVADREAHTIRKIDVDGNVTTHVGADEQPGHADGPRADARLIEPFAVAVDADGTIAIGDSGNNVIRLVDPDGEVRTIAGTPGAGQDTTDGFGPAARFGRPRALVFDADGSLLVADTFNDRLRRVTRTGTVTTYAGTTAGWRDGPLDEAQLSFPSGLALAVEDGVPALYVADAGTSIIRRLAGGTVSRFAGSASEVIHADGPAADARFFDPRGVLPLENGDLVVADQVNNVLRVIRASGVETIAGAVEEPAATDGPLASARFQSPDRFLLDGQGGWYVSDRGNNRIRHVSSDGVVSTFAGGQNRRGEVYVDGPRLDARFNSPAGLARDSAGNVYVADAANHCIRRIDTSGEVSTLAGSGLPGFIDGEGGEARFAYPEDLVVIDDETILVADALNHAIRKISLAGGVAIVSTLAGLEPENFEGVSGDADGTGRAAAFNTPRSMLRDGDDGILVADTNNSLIRRVTLAGEVTTVAGTRTKLGVTLGELPASLFEPTVLTRDRDGSVLVSFFTGVLRIRGIEAPQ